MKFRIERRYLAPIIVLQAFLQLGCSGFDASVPYPGRVYLKGDISQLPLCIQQLSCSDPNQACVEIPNGERRCYTQEQTVEYLGCTAGAPILISETPLVAACLNGDGTLSMDGQTPSK